MALNERSNSRYNLDLYLGAYYHVHERLGQCRSIFFISLSNYDHHNDHHSSLLHDQDHHANLKLHCSRLPNKDNMAPFERDESTPVYCVGPLHEPLPQPLRRRRQPAAQSKKAAAKTRKAPTTRRNVPPKSRTPATRTQKASKPRVEEDVIEITDDDQSMDVDNNLLVVESEEEEGRNIQKKDSDVEMEDNEGE